MIVKFEAMTPAACHWMLSFEALPASSPAKDLGLEFRWHRSGPAYGLGINREIWKLNIYLKLGDQHTIWLGKDTKKFSDPPWNMSAFFIQNNFEICLGDGLFRLLRTFTWSFLATFLSLCGTSSPPDPFPLLWKSATKPVTASVRAPLAALLSGSEPLPLTLVPKVFLFRVLSAFSLNTQYNLMFSSPGAWGWARPGCLSMTCFCRNAFSASVVYCFLRVSRGNSCQFSESSRSAKLTYSASICTDPKFCGSSMNALRNSHLAWELLAAAYFCKSPGRRPGEANLLLMASLCLFLSSGGRSSADVIACHASQDHLAGSYSTRSPEQNQDINI